MELRPHGLTARFLIIGIRSLVGVALFLAIHNHPVLYPQWEHLTLTQKLFRREPAITEFD
jgi:hypothetical protein